MEAIRSNYSTLSEIAENEAPEAPQYPYTEMVDSQNRTWLDGTEEEVDEARRSLAELRTRQASNRTSFQSILTHFFGDYFRLDADEAIATEMSSRWAAFARTGDPNYEGAKVEWVPWRYVPSDAESGNNEHEFEANESNLSFDIFDKWKAWFEKLGANSSQYSALDAQLEAVLREKALQALSMEVAEESEMITELRRTKGSKQDPENPFFSLKSLSSLGILFGSNNEQINSDGLPREAIRQIQRIAQDIGVLGTGLDEGNPRLPGGPSDEDFFPQLLELMWPPEGKLIERDCTCDFWDRIRCK